MIESLQDSSQFDSREHRVGSSLSIGPGRMGGSLIASKGKVASGFTSVIVQSGFRAGAGGCGRGDAPDHSGELEAFQGSEGQRDGAQQHLWDERRQSLGSRD